MNIIRNIVFMKVFFILILVQIVSPIGIGYDAISNTCETFLDEVSFYNYNEDNLLSQKYYEVNNNRIISNEYKQSDGLAFSLKLPKMTYSGPLDSPWPMQSHDNQHTGRSQYSTANITNLEKWRFRTRYGYGGGIDGSPIIGYNGIIYFGSKDCCLYALYPNGTVKWKYEIGDWISTAPVISKDGTLYVCSWNKYLYAFNSTTGGLKWKYYTDKILSISSPALSEDGTIYFGGHHYIFAIDSNGTEKWRYKTGSNIHSNPAIAEDGTIYVGSWDTYLYAMNPNGTIKWRFKTSDIIKGSPSIAGDGTVYIGSFDDYVYALYPNNGTMKWKCKMDYGTESNPSIAGDGTIYVGGYKKIYAIYPNGKIKWTFDIGSNTKISWSCPAISADGTIYVGTQISDVAGGDIIAINDDGTEKWRKTICDEWIRSSPCIAEDGTVYIGSQCEGHGYLHAFGPVESNSPPEPPTISGKTYGKVGENYEYKIISVDPDNNPISFYIEWGDGTHTGWTSERASGEKCYYTHSWYKKDNYKIRCKAKDTLDEESDWTILEITMPKNKELNNIWSFKLSGRFLQMISTLRPLVRP